MIHVTEKNLTECKVFQLIGKLENLNKMLHYKDLSQIKELVTDVEDLAWDSKRLLEERIQKLKLENEL